MNLFRTPLHIACAIGNEAAVEILLENNAKVNVADNDQKTPLIKAIEGQHEKCVELLLSYEAQVEICDKNGDNPVHHATKKESSSICQLVLDAGAKINEKNKVSFMPFNVATLHVCILILRHIMPSVLFFYLHKCLQYCIDLKRLLVKIMLCQVFLE